MTLPEADQCLLEADCADLDTVAAVLAERARAIAQYAAAADRPTLVQTLTVGEEFRERLELAQRNAEREIDRLRKLKRGLLVNLEPAGTDDQVVCFG